MSRWKSYEEYKTSVIPEFVTDAQEFNELVNFSALQRVEELFSWMVDVSGGVSSLRKLSSPWGESSEPDANSVHEAQRQVRKLVESAEYAFVHSRSLALSDLATDFIYTKSVVRNWEKYSARRIVHRVKRLVSSGEKLFDAMEAIRNQAAFLFKDTVSALPPNLHADFLAAREQFELELDEAGAFFAGRGLEGVLREIARKLQVTITQRNKLVSDLVHEADFYNLIEAMSRLKWKGSGSPVLDRKVKALLHYLRSARNATAHPAGPRSYDDEPDWRDIANLSAKATKQIWLASGKGRRKLGSNSIPRDW